MSQSLNLKTLILWAFGACVSISLICGIANPAFSENRVNWLGENLFDVIDRPIVYDYWGPIENFRALYDAVDTANHLEKGVAPKSLIDTDLFIFVLKNWQDVENIPYRFADLVPIISLVDTSSEASSRLIDFSVDDNGTRRNMRAYFLNLENVGDFYRSGDCLIPYIFATSLYKHKNRQLAARGCKKSGE